MTIQPERSRPPLLAQGLLEITPSEGAVADVGR